MTSQPDLQRKVRQLDNDVSAIYDLIFKIQNTQIRHGNRLDEIVTDLAAHDARFDRLDQRLDGVEQRLDGVEQRLEGLEQRLDGVEQRLEGLEHTMVDQFGRVLRLLGDDTEGSR